MSLRDPYCLNDQSGEALTQKNLDRLILVQVITDMFDGDGTIQKLVYFPEDEKVFKLSEIDVLLKTWKVLEDVLYILKVNNKATRKWSEYINKTIFDKKRGIKLKSDGAYIPNYVLDNDIETELILNSYFESTFSVRHLAFNKNYKKLGCIYLDESMTRFSIYNLRVAIY